MNNVNKIIVYISIGIILIIGYILVTPFFFAGIYIPFVHVPDEEIVKKAVTMNELKDKTFILCKTVRTTGYNYELIRDENGKRSYDYCLVTDSHTKSMIELPLEYEFETICNNIFIFYVVDKKEYYSNLSGEKMVEYIVDGWDILYPVKRVNLFNTAPGYVLKSDLYEP